VLLGEADVAHPVEDALEADATLGARQGAFLQFLDGGPPPRSTGTDALAVCEQLARIDVLIRGTR
jgi:hypothetical protein